MTLKTEHQISPGAHRTDLDMAGSLWSEADALGGWLGFDQFMHHALYHPTQGYYASGVFRQNGQISPIGATGDFITASSLGPWLGAVIAQHFLGLRDRLADRAEPVVIREYGAGNGDLAASILEALTEAGETPAQYQILEPSPFLRQVQQSRLSRLPPDSFSRVVWLEKLGPWDRPIRGLILANEVADALPVKVFEWQEKPDHIWEWGLSVSERGRRLQWTKRPARGDLFDAVKARQKAMKELGWSWLSGHRGEWCPWLEPWARSLTASLQAGEILILDYGYEWYELDHPDRVRGTLAGHRQHRRIDEWEQIISHPGDQDITAHVDFTQLANSLQTQGLVTTLQTQAAWLIDHGVLDIAEKKVFPFRAQRGQPPNDIGSLAALSGLQNLLGDSAMGQVFLVLSAKRSS